MTTPLIQNTISLANAAELIKKTVEQVGLVYIAPLDQAIQDEKISKALSQRALKGDKQ